MWSVGGGGEEAQRVGECEEGCVEGGRAGEGGGGVVEEGRDRVEGTGG